MTFDLNKLTVKLMKPANKILRNISTHKGSCMMCQIKTGGGQCSKQH